MPRTPGAVVVALLAFTACAAAPPPPAEGGPKEPVHASNRAGDSRPPSTTQRPDPSPAPAPPRALLGRVPDTNAYRVIACSTGPDSREACAKTLEQLVGREVGFLSGQAGRIVRTVDVRSGAGDNVRALELDRAGGPIAVFPAGSMEIARRAVPLPDAERDALKRQLRAWSPKAVYATTWSFNAQVFEADLDGDKKPDRVAVGEIEDSGAKGSRMLRGIWVSIDKKPFEEVAFVVDAFELIGSVDLDGDGAEEVLTMRTEGPRSKIDYDYTLHHVVPGKPLAAPKDAPSEGWQPFDRLEDHDHSDE